MPRYVHEGKTRVDFVPVVADISAPTTVELTAGTNLSPFIAKDGVVVPSSQNMVDSATIQDTFDAQIVGSFGGSITLTMFRDDDADDAWDLIVYGTNGFLVIRRGVVSTDDYATADEVEVYPVQMHEPIPSNTASNEQARFTAAFAVTAQPDLKAVVAA